MGSIVTYLLLFTDRGSTGLFMILVADFVFAIWLGLSVGFGGRRRGRLLDFSNEVD
jgi:hypothetical protein